MVWTANEPNRPAVWGGPARYVSDPASTSKSDFGMVGHERNGVFFRHRSADYYEPALAAGAAFRSHLTKGSAATAYEATQLVGCGRGCARLVRGAFTPRVVERKDYLTITSLGSVDSPLRSRWRSKCQISTSYHCWPSGSGRDLKIAR
jgi:hypothetical protein